MKNEKSLYCFPSRVGGGADVAKVSLRSDDDDDDGETSFTASNNIKPWNLLFFIDFDFSDEREKFFFAPFAEW